MIHHVYNGTTHGTVHASTDVVQITRGLQQPYDVTYSTLCGLRHQQGFTVPAKYNPIECRKCAAAVDKLAPSQAE